MKRIMRFLAIFLCTAALTAAQPEFYLRDGDTLDFYGDSITEQRFYTTFVETFVLTRYPDLHVRFVNSAWGGESVSGGNGGSVDARLKRDFVPYEPTVMTLMLGMNDGKYLPFDQQLFERYQAGIEHILTTVKASLPNLRITLIQPSPYDDATQPPLFAGGYNAVLLRYGAFLRELAAREHLTVADLNGPVNLALQKAFAADPAEAKKLMPDRIHPTMPVHLVMAEQLLKAWNASPTVTTVEIDAANSAVAAHENAEITELKSSATGASWTEKDSALPFFLDFGALPQPFRRTAAGVKLMLKSSDFVEELDREILRIRGLKPGSYQLTIDGNVAGHFTAEQLADGINLALLATPMARQAAEILQLSMKRADVHETRWKQFQMGIGEGGFPRVRSIEQELDALEADIVARQHATAQPLAHQFQLTLQ